MAAGKVPVTARQRAVAKRKFAALLQKALDEGRRELVQSYNTDWLLLHKLERLLEAEVKKLKGDKK